MTESKQGGRAGTSEVTREILHTRQIVMQGIRRSDGLYEVEGRLIDTKPNPFRAACAETDVPAGDPIHDMGVVLVFDDKMIVRDLRTFTNAAPYDICPLAGASLRAIIGLSMTRGWGAAVKAALAHADNCTHLVGLLGPMATTAFQSLSADRPGRAKAMDADGRPFKIDSCYAYGAQRSVVERVWPEFHIRI